jgi:hypothetical protein
MEVPDRRPTCRSAIGRVGSIAVQAITDLRQAGG